MEKIAEILEKNVAQGADTKDKVLGAAFVVLNKDGIIYSASAGRTCMDVASPKFATDSFAWVASLTKLPMTTCVLQLVQQGKIGLDDDLRELVPELGAMQILRGFTSDDKPILEDNPEPITLRQLLTHTVGLGYDIIDPDLVKWPDAIGRTARMNLFIKEGYNTPLKFKPGEAWLYGSALDWAGIVLEKVTGQKVGDYMKEHLLEPLNMSETGFYPHLFPQAAGRKVDVTIRQPDGTLAFFDALPPNPELESGGAGIFTTAEDYARLLRDLLHEKPSIVSAETAKQMFSPQLNKAQQASLQATCLNPLIRPAFVPEYADYPNGLDINFGFGGVLSMEGIPGQRHKGTLSWSGAANPRWWIDREAGIAAVLTTSVFPHGDSVASNMFLELEKEVYKNL